MEKLVSLNSTGPIKTPIKYLFSLLFLYGSLTGQDIHFSQFDGSLLNNSPAFTGLFNGDYRVGAIYRSQWQSVPVPYSTFSMNGEAVLKPKSLVKDMVGVGVLFNSDKAGDTRYGTTHLYFSGSYLHTANQDSSLMFSAGLNVGWCQVGFDYDRMTFDNQFDGLQYNSSLASRERFTWTKYNYADFNFGAAVQYRINRSLTATYALSLLHLTTPVISYQGNAVSKLDMKIGNYLRAVKVINPKMDFVGEALFNKQGKYYEVIPHTSLKYYFDRDDNKAVLGGVCWRARDAVIFRVGYTYKTMNSGIAYDINTSRFTAATNRRGAFEIFINYIIKREPTYTAKKRVCPVFM
ncbi:MAG: hypothetical protein K0S12_904 [Bacteroidetes bacterium]|nr:hypothetical protein [Bacteroidota bacterium]